MRNWLPAIFLVLVAAGSCAAQAQRHPNPPPEVAIRAGKILDVRTGSYATDQIIWIEGDRIKAVGNTLQYASRVLVTQLSRIRDTPGQSQINLRRIEPSETDGDLL